METTSVRFAVVARAVRKAPASPKEEETFGRRLARTRKAKGFTQVELGERVGLIQALISDYERDKLRPYADVVARFAEALEVTTDELLGLSTTSSATTKPLERRFTRRLQQISNLPKRDQDALLRTIDAFVSARRH